MQSTPFKIQIAEYKLVDLLDRLERVRWPPTPSNLGWRLGVEPNYLRELINYWRMSFDWRAAEARLNATPQFLVEIDGVRIHVVHLRSRDADAIPIVLTHGWPGSFVEMMKIAPMLVDPSAYGLDAARGFSVVIPSLPGFGFSDAAGVTGLDLNNVADTWAELMIGLGYERFGAHGGDLGAGISTRLAFRHPDRLLGLHLNFIPGSFQPLLAPNEAPTRLERDFLSERAKWIDEEGAYSHVQATKPLTLGYGLNDSPVGLAAWICEKFLAWSERDLEGRVAISRDDMLTNISIYWFSETIVSSFQFYWEGRSQPLAFAAGERVSVPTAVARFPKELPTPPRSWVERAYNIVRWTEMPRGGHFAALETPYLLAADLRAFFDSIG